MAQIRERNFWLDPAGEPARVGQGVPDRVDVAVAGAGFTGLSAARALASGGASVAVFEAESVGFGASSLALTNAARSTSQTSSWTISTSSEIVVMSPSCQKIITFPGNHCFATGSFSTKAIPILSMP